MPAFALPCGHLYGSPVQSLMVVDDTHTQRAHVAQMCAALGIAQVHESSNGKEALQKLSQMPRLPDLLVIELQLPEMDGVEFIGQLHALDWRIPLLIVSRQPLGLIHAVEQMARDIGMPVLGALSKPLVPEQLQRALQHYQKAISTQTAAAAPALPLPITAQDLSNAIAAGELQVHYQPKADIQSGKVHGVEALARWTHPTLGAVPPDQFIALAERENLIHDLTLQVLSQALEQTAQWQAQGHTLSLAVNFSPLLLRSTAIVQEVMQLTEQYGIHARQVVLEITESAGVDHLGDAISVLARLRLKGFGLSIDDYGTGFSSMQQLTRLPFTELKIDRSFVHGAHEHRNLCVILQSALDMARRLDLVTVAEGIETMDDWLLLQRYGCAVGQGYLISRPMPAQDFLRWMEHDHRKQIPLLSHAGARTPVSAALV